MGSPHLRKHTDGKHPCLLATWLRRTMTMKDCRAVLEKDLNLAASALKPHKDYVTKLVDKARRSNFHE